MSRSFNITEMDKIKELIQQLQLYATSNNYNLMSDDNNKKEKNSNLDYDYKDNIKKENENKKNYFLNEEKKNSLNKEEENFFNLPLNIIYKNFLTTWNNIILDLIYFFSNLQELEKKDNIFEQSILVLKKISFIFFRNDRIIYTGISFIILSFFTYFILVSK